MRSTKISLPLVLIGVLALVSEGAAQAPTARPRIPPTQTLPLRESSRKGIASELGGAFMFPARCDADGNLYIRKYATDRPLLGPIVKIDAEGKRVASFDPAAVSQLKLDRADAFAPAGDGGLYQIAAVGIAKPQIYVLHFSSDGSPASPIRIDADFQPYQFAPFADGNLLITGYRRDQQGRSDSTHPQSAVFSSDGRLLAPVAFADDPKPAAGSHPVSKPVEKSSTTLDLADAEPGSDGNIYVLRRSNPALIYVVSPAGQILRTLKVISPARGIMPNTFHVAANRLAISFWEEGSGAQTLVVVDAQTGRRIATYADPGTLGPAFACYSADEGVFTFLHLADGNALEVVRAESH